MASRRSPLNPYNRLSRSKDGAIDPNATPLNKRNGPHKAIPAEIRVSLLAAFYQERPKPEELVAWCRLKAEQFGCHPEGLSTLVGNLTLFLEREVQMLLGNEAEKFAAAAGLTLTRTLSRLNQLLDCEKPMAVRQGKDEPDQIIQVPDNQVRHSAVATALTYFGKLEQRHSVKTEHEHNHRHIVMNMSDDEVLEQIRQLNQKTQTMLLEAEKQVIDVKSEG